MKNIFFIGINGIGMSGLAKIMLELGYEVSGSDLKENYMSKEMEKKGIRIYYSHNEKNIKDADTIIVSTAISEKNPEYAKALKEKLVILKRGELLAKLLNKKIGIAVAGTHGKTTTSSMLATVALEKKPTIVVGGIVSEIKSNSKYGRGQYFIAEADESDNSFLYMKPSYSVITNIEEDHMEKHGSLENIKKSFYKFICQTKNEVIACLDCLNLKEIIYEINDLKKIKTYSLENKSADIYAENIKVKKDKTYFDVFISQKFIGEFVLSIPGKHNIYNSLPVIYLAIKMGIDIEKVKEKIDKFTGAKRRYDILLDNKKYKIIDDYAHHPTEIRATLEGAKSIEKENITVIFQPHRFSRMKFLLEKFEGVFEKANQLILLPVYSAGEKDDFGISLEKLAKKINHPNVKIIKEEKELEKELLKGEKKKVDIFMGAGSISLIAHRFAKKIEGK
ncbi:MAG: UDP-N-acetylmuramate--L-alanine ligase [Fusobacterium sp. JB021]|nr:UDP-N-acetylmuramate--L-alanine ligase [Fusobacterium sp. JB020]MDP0493087.1 UDP-N-acetylmuramate--L-alanine ligase [Fusobacterium sp. JB021]MDP0507519.1 UDP-N-acetylmuramate--L-alanine ligase [Fusobacterium sp. JB019]